MPEIQTPYLPAEEDTEGRLRALGVLSPYTPAAAAAYGLPDNAAPAPAPTPAAAQPVGPAAPSWSAYKAANNFDSPQMDYLGKQQIWDSYRNNIIGDIASANREDPGTLRDYFDQTYAADKPKAPTRSALDAVTDTLGAAAGGAAGSLKSVVDLFAPGSAASTWLGDEQKYYGNNASPVVQDEQKRVAREVAEDEAKGGSGIGPSIAGMVRSPLQTAAEFAGGVAPALAAGALTGGSGLLAEAPAAVARAAQFVGPAVMAAQGGGQVRGAVYDKLQSTPDAALLSSSPAYARLRQAGMSEPDAKAELASVARNWPEIGSAALLNAVTARIAPVERRLAGLPGALSRPAAAGVEAATNAAQGGGTQLATNVALQGVDPTQQLSQGVGQATAAGAVLGGLAGAAFGAHAPNAADEAASASAPQTTAADAAIPPNSVAVRPDANLTADGRATVADAQYNVMPDDITAVLDTLPKVVKRDYVANHLASDLRNGTLEQTAQQQNSLGRAAQALLDRISVRALPAPPLRLSGPARPGDAAAAAGTPTPTGLSVEGSAYNATSDDITAALSSLPKMYNRQWATDYLTSALRNGSLEDAARQQNSIGRAAQTLLARVQERSAPRQLGAPETRAALPSPDMPDVGGDTLVDASGAARAPTYQESADARAARQNALDSGLTPDVRAAQDARARPGDGAMPDDDTATQSAAGSAAAETAAPTSDNSPPMVLQNRDRQTAGAIAQMNAIAADPDPGRLSFSRDFANGAPVVEANPDAPIPAAQLGREDYSVTADGRRVPVQYAVVDADTLLTSNNADGTPNTSYAQGEPDRLRAIAGNGRVAGLQAAYERGTAGSYRSGIGADSALTGVAPGVIAKMRNPVLVRVMPREAVTHDIGDVSNTTGTAALSPVEQAANDAQRVNLEAMDFSDAGEPTPQTVRQFVQAMPVGERVGMLNPDGSPTRQAVDRLMSATFHKAYGDPELVRLYAQATDPEARTVLGGMASAAGSMARLEGAGDLDVRPLVTDAARLAVNARRSGAKLQDLARQGDIAMSPDARVFVRLFADNARSGKRIGEALQRVADFAHDEATKPTEDMFGTVERANRAQVLENVDDTTRPQNLGVAVGREPAQQDRVRQDAGAARSADGRPVEEGRAAGPREVATGGGQRNEVEGRDSEPLLGSQTPDELRARDEQQRAHAADRARTQRQAEERAQADDEAKDFRLTGSDRAADVAAAHGQGDLLEAGAEQHDRNGHVERRPKLSGTDRIDYPVGRGSEAIVKAKRDVVDYMNGDITRSELLAELNKSGLQEGELAMVAHRLGDDSLMSGEVDRLVKGQWRPDNQSRFDRTGESGDRSTAVDLERDRTRRATGDAVGAQNVRGDAGRSDEGTGPAGSSAAGEGRAQQGDRGVSDGSSAVAGAARDQRVREPRKRSAVAGDAAGADRSERSGGSDDEAVRADRGERGDAVRSARAETGELTERIAAQEKADRDTKVKVGDLANIRETLPVLLPEQQDDVAKAERRFFRDDQPGILFTNGTGTGKTYTGLGIAKRFDRLGKHNILFLAPTDAKVKDWIEDGKNLKLNISQLESTSDAGKGRVATTYANFGQNEALVHRNWDLIVADESHYLMSNEAGVSTDALQRLRELTNHPDALRLKAQSYFAKEARELKAAEDARLNELQRAGMHQGAAAEQMRKEFEDRRGALNQKVEAQYDDIKDEKPSNVVFLSATPFAYHKTLDYGNGYLWPAWRHGNGYGTSERDQFYLQNLGYQWRYHRLESPSAEVNQSYLERELHRKLVESGAVSGRKLELDRDYSRDFVEIESGAGRKIDAALSAIRDHKGPYKLLGEYVHDRFDYHARNRLLENLKADDAVERAKKHLALGRKVVVFHGYKTGHTINPFDFPERLPSDIGTHQGNAHEKWRAELQQFRSEFPDIGRMNFNRLGNPIEAFTKAFGDRLALVNGDVPKGQRVKNIREFNKDGGKKDVILVQTKAGKEGISLHDTTGKHQRALIALPLPTSPTDAIQIEGRIYRTGNKSHAAVEYMKAGLDFEQHTFANTIAQRARTAENFALGHGARDLERAFKDGYINSSAFEPHEGQGVGGKEADHSADTLTPYQKAETLYFAKQKERGRRDQRHGKDWYATPEPVGLKMVEWAGLRPGEKALEPSAGDGAIARFFPEQTQNTFIEPSNELQSRLALNARGEVKPTTFEEHHVVNKYDGIVMNPPFGVGGKTAIDHVEKAMIHLRDGGRIVALIPEGISADKRLQALLESDAAKHVYTVADVSLPTSAFERAGTGVKTHIVVLEKQTNPEAAARLHMRTVDLSGAATPKELFKRLEHVEFAERAPMPESGKRGAGAARFSRAESESGLTSDEVRRAIDADTYGHNVDVYDTLADAPDYVRRQAEREGADDVEGFFDPRTNRVALIAGNLRSAERAREVARHELIGHYGIENMVGRETMNELARKVLTAERLGNKVFREIGAEVDRTQPDLPDGRRAREIIAMMAERNMQNSVVRRVLDGVRQFLRKIGLLRGDTTDAEIAGLLREAQAHLKEQGRPSIANPEATAAFTRQGDGGAESSFGQRADLFEHPDMPVTRLTGRELGNPNGGKAFMRAQAIKAIREFADAPAADRTNADTGWTFTVSRINRSKIAEDRAAPVTQLQAIAGLRDLVQHAVLAETHTDLKHSNPDVKAIHRLYAPLEIAGVPYRAKLTVKDYTLNDGTARKNLHALETVELERADGARNGSDVAGRQSQPPDVTAGNVPDLSATLKDRSTNHGDTMSIAELLRGAERDGDGKPFGPVDASFSRAGTPRAPVPMAEREPTVLERMREMWRNPQSSKDTARALLSEGSRAAQPEWLENFVTAAFDHRNPVEQVIRRTGDTAAGRALRNTMRSFEAATQATLNRFSERSVDPMTRALKDAWKQTFSKQDWYKEHGWRQFLQDVGTIGNLVKHGRERNAEIARKTDGNDLAGSGATDAEIAAFEKHFRESAPGLIEFYEGLYRDHLKPMLEYADQTRREAGLLTPEMEAARPKYEWYLPLYGDPDEVEGGGGLPSGGSLKAPKDKQAMGRSGTLADNPLQNVLVSVESAVRNAGMQKFKKDFASFVKETPGARALMSAKVNEAPNFEIFEKYVDKRDGLVKQRVKANAAMSPDAIVLRDGDRTTVIHVGNRKVLDAIKGTNRAQIDGLMGLPLKATRTLSRVYTSWNPVFPFMNKMRDVMSMASLVMADAPTKDKLGAVRRMLANNATFTPQWRAKPGSEYHSWLKRFEDLGGATQYADLFRDDIMKNIESEFGKMAGVNTKFKAKAAAQKIGDFIDHVNEHMEMTSRVSLFKALVESGVPERDAMLYAKNTMNFETKGKIGQQLGALYTFAGPAMYDARRMAQALRTPRGAAVMAAHFALMYGLYGALKAMGGQDDDGVDRLNKVPVSQSGRYLTMIDPSDPDGRGFKIPVGFGFQRIALTLAAALHRYADGVDDTGTFLSNTLKDGVLSNFSPLDPTDIDPSKDLSQWAMQQFAPSVAKPLLQLALNSTGQGNPIHKPDEWTGNKLHFEQAWPQTSGLFRGLAKQIYDSTGVDVYPETLQFLMRSYGGGGALDAIKAIDALGEKADVDKYLTDIPLARSFGSGPLPQDMTTFRQNSTDIDRLQNERAYAEKQGTLDTFDAANPGIAPRAAIMKAANAEIKSLYKARQEALTDEDPAQRQQRALDVNRRIRAVQMRANKAYQEALANAG
ncbi:LPD38 domain-containing protein [Paraburkholderia antibiotica]|uniref:DEAD/DEAH box helicase family protein n=1 Tax=Paraburkholderia antibiotica TaxID=2728839 RepID=A0A7Y0A0Z0_9BURK|nr:LPD38 domain-containing protein [Paraburkholderia antibiotica]NML34506.1 DEAD/DEAH box helicase family protein [Paraburkholderia antibiotica]